MKLLLTFLLSLLSISLTAQRYTERTDPANPKRKIVTLTLIIRKLPETVSTRNLLDEDKSRKPIPFQTFELKNPRTGKVLDPNAKMTLKLPDGSTRVTTVKAFYDQVNEMEKQLTARGRSLRQPNTLKDLRAAPDQKSYLNYNANKFSNYSVNKFRYLPKTTGGRPGPLPVPVIITKAEPEIIVFNMNNLWNADMYVSLLYENQGTSEFPTEWAKVSGADNGRNKYPVIGQLPAKNKDMVKKILWQLSSIPFDNTLKDINPPGVIKSFEQTTVFWTERPRGWESLPDAAKKTIASSVFFYNTLDLTGIVPYPAGEPVTYYIRTVLYNDKNEAIKFPEQIIFVYGHTKDKANEVHLPPAAETNSVPGFKYSFPDNTDIPFGMFVKGSGLSSYKSKGYAAGDKTWTPITTGYKLQANAALGIRYFNFPYIFNAAEPASKELTMISADFKGMLGTGPTWSPASNGVSLTLSGLDGLIKPFTYEFTNKIPGTDIIDIGYAFKQPIEIVLVNQIFFLGPVPIRIEASILGEAGINLSGQFDPNNLSAGGEIRPYLNSQFKASGGVDAIIAFGTLNADVNPLLSLNMPLTFSSTSSKPLSFNTTISGLKGRVYLKAGFYYPCPSLSKIVGWITGDEELPLCECVWEYNIFEFAGFEHKLGY